MKHPISPDTSGLYEKIWNFVREQLSVRYPFFRRLLWNFSFQESSETSSAGTDGRVIYFCPDFLLKNRSCPTICNFRQFKCPIYIDIRVLAIGFGSAHQNAYPPFIHSEKCRMQIGVYIIFYENVFFTLWRPYLAEISWKRCRILRLLVRSSIFCHYISCCGISCRCISCC